MLRFGSFETLGRRFNVARQAGVSNAVHAASNAAHLTSSATISAGENLGARQAQYQSTVAAITIPIGEAGGTRSCVMMVKTWDSAR